MTQRLLINLLPHRENARLDRRKSFNIQLALAAAVGLLISALAYWYYDLRISNQKSNNQLLVAENAKLDAKIKEVASLQKEIDALKAKQSAVENLQHERNLPVHLLNELNTNTPDGIYLLTLKQEGKTITLTGSAQSNDRISQFLRNLSQTKWLTKPELVEITAGTLALSQREQRKVANFTLKVSYVKLEPPGQKTVEGGAATNVSGSSGQASKAATATPAVPAPSATPLKSGGAK